MTPIERGGQRRKPTEKQRLDDHGLASSAVVVR